MVLHGIVLRNGQNIEVNRSFESDAKKIKVRPIGNQQLGTKIIIC